MRLAQTLLKAPNFRSNVKFARRQAGPESLNCEHDLSDHLTGFEGPAGRPPPSQAGPTAIASPISTGA